VNFDAKIAESKHEPIILNELNSITEQDKEHIARLTTTVYDNVDVFSNEASCECGKLRGGYNLHVMCQECKTIVLEPFAQGLDSRVWIRAPKGVDALMNPVVWTMLSRRFTKAGFNLVEWLCSTDYQPSVDRPPRDIAEIEEMGFSRGFNNFVRNFDTYFDKMCQLKAFGRKPDDQLRELLLNTSRDCIFSRHLPLPNKALLLLENTPVGRFIDPTVPIIVDAIRTITSIDTAVSSLNTRQRENRAVKAIVKLADYYYGVYSDQLAKKQGIIRKNVFGTRVHFSSRAVISSNTGPHLYDELWIAWGHGVTMLSLHLKNKLMRFHGYTPNEATALLNEYTVKYHPLIDQLFQELIAESPDKGLWCIFERNPSLSRASTQRMKITRVKTDVNDPTITLSILSVKGFNADPFEPLTYGVKNHTRQSCTEIQRLRRKKATSLFPRIQSLLSTSTAW
jgi:hypothetical protein